MEKYCIINIDNKYAAEKISSYGYKCIATEKTDSISEYIAGHADVLYLKINDKMLYVSSCQNKNINILEQMGVTVKKIELSKGYKTESKLNLVLCSDMILYNPKTSVDISGLDKNKNLICTKQGYTKCSTIVVDEGFITEDENIYKKLIDANRKCLIIKKGFVNLYGYDYGFIGGASIFLREEKILLFFGDIRKHPDFKAICDFCSEINVKVDYIKNMELTDIGGGITLELP